MDLVEDGGTMLASKGVTTIARQQTGEQVLISACGRTCSIDVHYTRSITELQAALQRTLQMEGQAFHICDINGQLLSTDMQVQDAIAQGLTPLCATLPDKSLHHLENRREELAQMQWKLVRDQMTQSTNQVTQLSREINEMKFQMQALQRECVTSLDQFRQEMGRAIEMERMTTKAELQPIQEAVNGAVLLINGERSKRELSVQGFEKHIHGVCDMLDGERAQRRQDLAMHMAVIQEIKSGLDDERNARENNEEILKDTKMKLMELQESVSGHLQDSRDQVQRMKADSNISVSDALVRLAELEDRCAGLESTVNDASTFNSQTFDKLGERNERVAQAVETLRLSSKHYEGGIANSLERVKDIETLVREYDIDVRDQMAREKQAREDSIRRFHQNCNNDSKKQVGEVEKRLTVRLERESAEREKNFQSMIDEVARLLQERRTSPNPVTGAQTTSWKADATKILGNTTPRDAFVSQSPNNSFQPSVRMGSNDTTPTTGEQAHEKVVPILGGFVSSSSPALTSSRSGTPLRTTGTPRQAATVLHPSSPPTVLSQGHFVSQTLPAYSAGSLSAPPGKAPATAAKMTWAVSPMSPRGSNAVSVTSSASASNPVGYTRLL